MAYSGGFTLVREGADTQMIELNLSSVTTVVGDVLELVDGASTWALCTSTSNARTLKAVAQEAVTSGSAAKAILVNETQLWVAETNAASNSAHVGDRMALTDANTVNNSGTDQTGATGVFIMLQVVGATSENRILGRFCGLYGNATV